MKIIVILMIALFCGANVYGQNLRQSDVPADVKTKFSTMYPGATGVKWEKENGLYEAEFKENGTETSVLFESNGKYIQTEVEIPVSSLPSAVNDYVTNNLSGKKITEACQITNSNGNITYEAEIGKDDYLFDGNGKFIGKDTDNGDTEDDK